MDLRANLYRFSLNGLRKYDAKLTPQDLRLSDTLGIAIDMAMVDGHKCLLSEGSGRPELAS